jgi:lipopolysaccharide assembly protein A
MVAVAKGGFTMRLVGWFISVGLFACALSFALSNLELATFRLWPFPFSLTVPLFAGPLVALALGALMGGAVVWFDQAALRRKARQAQAARPVAHQADSSSTPQ